MVMPAVLSGVNTTEKVIRKRAVSSHSAELVLCAVSRLEKKIINTEMNPRNAAATFPHKIIFLKFAQASGMRGIFLVFHWFSLFIAAQ